MKKLWKEPRIIILIVALLISLYAIRPHISPDPETGLMSFKTNIKKGLDLEGGVRVLLLPKDNTEEVVAKSIRILTTRINTFGLKEMKILPVTIDGVRYIQLEMAGSTEEQLRKLIEQQGKFEAIINKNVPLINNKGVLNINGGELSFSIDNETLFVDGKMVFVNDTFNLNDIDFKYINKSEKNVVVGAIVYSGDDILQIFKDAQHSNIREVGPGSWRFQFTVLVSKESAGKFAKITKDIEMELSPSGENYLKESLDLYLDNMLVDSLNIVSNLRGRVLTQPSITGPGATQKEATNKMKYLQSVLESGALPSEIEIVELNSISPTLGHQFMRDSIIAILVAILAVSMVVFLRYKDPKVVLPIIITATSEVFIILGAAAIISWTIDLAAIAGLIAAIGSGVDDLIIITDESEKTDELRSIKNKMKKVFFIIFVAAGTTIAAMLPLFSLGAGAIKGFAFTTILGVLIGIFITTPAYAKTIEHIRQ